MRLPSRQTASRVGFVLSLAVLTLVYGWLSRARGWFPDSLLVDAWNQGRRVVTDRTEPPDFTNSRVYRGGGVDVEDGDAVQPGLTLITSTWEHMDWDPGLVLIDREGNVLHQWRVRPTELFSEEHHRRGESLSEQDIHGTHLYPDGDVVVNVEYAGTVRMDACGDPEWRVMAGNHHSVHPTDDGSLWIPAVSELRTAESPEYPDGFPGLEGPIFHDHLMRVSAEDAEVLEAINVMDVLFRNDLARYLPKNRQHEQRDVVHLNDIEPLADSLDDEYPAFEAGDLLVSLRNLDLVFVLDPESREVRWHAADPFIMQHDPDFIGGGWIGVLDNNWDDTPRGEMLGGSRIVAVQPHTDSVEVRFPTSESDPFYTAHRGKWQRLANGNMLLAESDAGRVVEVAPDGRTVWEFVAPPYSEERVASVTRAERVDLTREQVSAWSCPPGS